MEAIVKHDGEIIAVVQTNRSMSIVEALEVAGVDINEQEGGEDKYDYNRMTIEMQEEPAEIEDPIATTWDLNDIPRETMQRVYR